MHRLLRAEQYVPVKINGKDSPFTTAAPIPKKYEAKLYRFAPAFMDRAAECDVLYQSLLIDGWAVRSYQNYARDEHVLELSVQEPFFMLHSSLEGYVDLEMSDGKKHRLLPGQYRLVQFNMGKHLLKFKGKRWYEAFFIDFPWDWTAQMASKSGVLQWLLDKMEENLNGIIPCASRMMGDQVYELIDAIRNRQPAADSISLAHTEAQIRDLALYAIEQLPPSMERLCMDAPSQIGTIKSFMTNNITRLSSVEEIAANFGFSVRSFQQLFKNSTGETIRDFILRSKM